MKTHHLSVVAKEQAPYVRYKAYDHEDIDVEFTASGTLNVLANVLASLGVFALLMCAIAIVAQVPESWLSWIVLALGGV